MPVKALPMNVHSVHAVSWTSAKGANHGLVKHNECNIPISHGKILKKVLEFMQKFTKFKITGFFLSRNVIWDLFGVCVCLVVCLYFTSGREIMLKTVWFARLGASSSLG